MGTNGPEIVTANVPISAFHAHSKLWDDVIAQPMERMIPQPEIVDQAKDFEAYLAAKLRNHWPGVALKQAVEVSPETDDRNTGEESPALVVNLRTLDVTDETLARIYDFPERLNLDAEEVERGAAKPQHPSTASTHLQPNQSA